MINQAGKRDMDLNLEWGVWAALGGLTLWLMIAAWCDIRTRRIPNWLVFSGMIAGLSLNVLLPSGFGFASALPGGLGWQGSLVGLAAGLFLMLPFYLLRAMGAGDVKLMAMVGAFLGLKLVLGAIIFTFLAGGLMAIAVALRSSAIREVLRNVRMLLYMGTVKLHLGQVPTTQDIPVSGIRMPYGVAIAVGTLAYLMWCRMT